MDWLHCNKCFGFFNKTIKYYLSECGHISCEKCIQNTRKKNVCAVCSKNVGLILLSKDMDAKFYEFFLPVEMLQKKVIEVLEFQNKQRKSLNEYLLKRYDYIKKECMSLNETNKQLIKENKKLQEMLRTAGNNPRPFLNTSTPRSAMSIPQFDNISLRSSIIQNSNNYGQDKIRPSYFNIRPSTTSTINNLLQETGLSSRCSSKDSSSIQSQRMMQDSHRRNVMLTLDQLRQKFQ